MSQSNQTKYYVRAFLLPLKASALATAIALASPLVSASEPWISTKGSSLGAATTEVTSPTKVHISDNDEYPTYQDLEFAKYWKNHAASALTPKDIYSWQPELLQQFRLNQIQIARAVDSAQHLLDMHGKNFEEEKVKSRKRHNELQDQYSQCAMDNNSWADNAAGLLGFLGVANAVFVHPGAAVALIGCSCGAYFLSGMIKQMEMSRLQKALKQNDIDFEILTSSAKTASQSFQQSTEELQEARTLILQNIALFNNGDWLTDRSRSTAVQGLFKNSRYRHMKMPVEVSASYLEGEIYGQLVSQSDDDVFVITMGNASTLPDSKNSYKLLRSDNRFYIPIPSKAGMEYLEFSSAQDALGFFRNLAYTHKAKRVGFINLDPLPTLASH